MTAELGSRAAAHTADEEATTDGECAAHTANHRHGTSERAGSVHRSAHHSYSLNCSLPVRLLALLLFAFSACLFLDEPTRRLLAAKPCMLLSYHATVVSGYWEMPSFHRSTRKGNHARSAQDYARWLHNSLNVNAPYIVFSGSQSDRQLVSRARGDAYPTLYLPRPLASMRANSILPAAWSITASGYTDARPRDLSLVWLDKLAMLQEAAALNPYDTEWVAWVDAGLSIYRRRAPPSTCPWPQNNATLASWPRTSCIFAQSDRGPDFISASVLMVHRSSVGAVADAFYATLVRCVAERNSTACADDQAIMRLAADEYPALFWAVNDIPKRHKANWGLIFTTLA